LIRARQILLGAKLRYGRVLNRAYEHLILRLI